MFTKLIHNLPKRLMYNFYVDDAVELSFTPDSVLLHHAMKTTVLTTMGLVVKTIVRRKYCTAAISNVNFLITKW